METRIAPPQRYTAVKGVRKSKEILYIRAFDKVENREICGVRTEQLFARRVGFWWTRRWMQKCRGYENISYMHKNLKNYSAKITNKTAIQQKRCQITK